MPPARGGQQPQPVRRCARSALVRSSGGCAPVRPVLWYRREKPGVQQGGGAQSGTPLTRRQCTHIGSADLRSSWPAGSGAAVVMSACSAEAAEGTPTLATSVSRLSTDRLQMNGRSVVGCG